MKKRFIFIFAIVAIVGLGIFARPQMSSNVHAEDTRMVTVHVDGETKTVATNAVTVGEVLARLKVNLAEHDKTEPSLNTPVAGSDFTVNLYRARPITVVDGPNSYTAMTAERSPKKIAEDAGFTTQQEDQFAFERSDDPFEGAPGTQMVIKRAKAITFDLYGTASPLRTHEITVGDLLTERDIALDAGDELNVPKEARITEGMLVKIIKVGKEVKTVEEEIAFSEEKIQDVNQPTSYRQVKEVGQNGKKLVTYEIVTHNGIEAVKNSVKEVITQEPVKQVVVVGTKAPLVVGPAEIIERINYWSDVRGIDGNRVARIAKCESTFNPNADNGHHKGLFQQDPDYWPKRAATFGVAGASIFDVEAQIIVATGMMAGGGWSHWSCK